MVHLESNRYRRRRRARRTPPLTDLRRLAALGEDGLRVAAGEGVGVVGTHFGKV